MADHPMNWRRFAEPGLMGDDLDEQNKELRNIVRLDDAWPEDDQGAKLSLGVNFMDLVIDHMETGDIKMQTNAEAVDPPRKDNPGMQLEGVHHYDRPEPGSQAFGSMARSRRSNIRRAQVAAGEVQDADVTDVISGKKTSLGERKQELEEAGND